jgi:transmembrane sensor
MRKLREEAARWLTRMHGAAPDDPERGRFEAGLMSYPVHAAEYEAFADLWGSLDWLARCDAVAEVMERERQFCQRFIRQDTLNLFLAGGSAEVAHRQWQSKPLWRMARQTGVGQVEQQSLQDGDTRALTAPSCQRGSRQHIECGFADNAAIALQAGSGTTPRAISP